MRYVLFFLTALGAFLIQTVTGFGGPPIALPIGIALLGVEISKPAVTLASFLSATMVAAPGWRDVNKRELLKMTGVMLAFSLGGMLLYKVGPLSVLLPVYGAVVIAIGLKKLFLPARGTPPRWLMYVCICLAGLMQGLFVSGGSFLAVYAFSVMREKQELRTTLNAVWAAINLLLLAGYLVDGSFAAVPVPVFGIVAGATVCGVWLGNRLAVRLDKNAFLKVAYVLLVVSGGILLVTNL